MSMDIHRQAEGTGPQNSQKLPSFAAFLSFSTVDKTRPPTLAERPSSTWDVSPKQSTTGASNQSHYGKAPSPSSAGDKFRNWFPEACVEQELRTVLIDPWASKTSASKTTSETRNTMLRSALVGPQAEQCGPPRRTSLPSISALTSQGSQDPERDPHPWRRASTSNTTSAANPVVSLHNSQVGTVSPGARHLMLPAVHMTSPTGPQRLPTRPGSLGRRPLAVTGPEKFELAFHSPRPSETPADDAPSAPPPSPATRSIEMRVGGDLESSLTNLTSTALHSKLEKKKSPGRDNIEQWPSPRVESERKRYKCPFEGCGRQYTWKENLTRHHTTRHAPMPTPRRCPFCKVNAARLSFNRIDNFKEHILRHSRERDNCRARTEFHPRAEEFYRWLSEEAKGERRRVKGRERRMSPRSEVSDESVEAPEGL